MKRILYGLLIVLMIGLAVYALSGADVRRAKDKAYGAGDFSYSGLLKNGKFSGYGEISFRDGSGYKGEFEDGDFNGAGVYTASGGWRFEGVFEKGELQSGTFYDESGKTTFEWGERSEILTSSEGWKHEGAFGDSGQMGVGGFTFADGARYEGDFLNGLADGEIGAYYTKDGEKLYEGAFKAGLFEGKGIYYSPDGWKYEGAFKDGRFSGDGVITDKDKTIKGVWENGRQVKRYE